MPKYIAENDLSPIESLLADRHDGWRIGELEKALEDQRINFTYSLLPTLNLKAAWGIYQQELVTISDEDEILALFEPWIIIPE